MLIFTSNYGKAQRARNDSDRLYVRVSASAPKWFTKPCVELPEVYPPWELIRGYKDGVISEEFYTNRYSAQLTDDVKESVMKKLIEWCEETGASKVVFLCWCSGFCHRHILNKWIGGEGEVY